MQFLKLKRRENRASEAYFVTARAKYDKGRREEYINKKKSYVVTGDADSGKTRLLRKLFAEHGEIYKTLGFYFGATEPVADWLEQADGKNQREKLENLLTKIMEAKAVVYFDDLHKLAGRKLQIAKLILNHARIYWLTTIDIQRIPPTLRRFADTDKVKLIELNSDVAFDGTIGIVILLVIAGVMAGHPELAIMAGIGGLLANGRLGSSNKT
ncbi:MAG: hypothetical protein RBS36_11580 [Thiomicrospira sp.]|nr:hypothetical protein [Thiomicrospira sp.]